MQETPKQDKIPKNSKVHLLGFISSKNINYDRILWQILSGLKL
jgi:hypothetical protein